MTAADSADPVWPNWTTVMPCPTCRVGSSLVVDFTEGTAVWQCGQCGKELRNDADDGGR